MGRREIEHPTEEEIERANHEANWPAAFTEIHARPIFEPDVIPEEEVVGMLHSYDYSTIPISKSKNGG